MTTSSLRSISFLRQGLKYIEVYKLGIISELKKGVNIFVLDIQ